MKKRSSSVPLKGYAVCKPNGHFMRTVASTREWCKTEAAMHFVDRNSCTMPSDWEKAQKAGYRVVRAMICEVKK